MFWIKRKGSILEMQERHLDGSVDYTNFPIPEYTFKQGQLVAFTFGVLRFTIDRQNLVVPQGESIESLLVAIQNPSPDISGGSGGGNIEENEVQVSSGTYFILSTDKNIICTGDCTVVLPLTTSGKFAFRIWALPGVTVSIKGTAPETVNNETDFIISNNEMVTVQNLSTEPNWAIGH
jgi:hypothetical protein